MHCFKEIKHTTGMKKLAILLLTVFTVATAAACGCADTKKDSSFEDVKGTESIQLQADEETEKIEQDEQTKQDEQIKPECPDCKKRDGECPIPRKPHIRPHNKTPHPRPSHRKDK